MKLVVRINADLRQFIAVCLLMCLPCSYLHYVFAHKRSKPPARAVANSCASRRLSWGLPTRAVVLELSLQYFYLHFSNAMTCAASAAPAGCSPVIAPRQAVTELLR